MLAVLSNSSQGPSVFGTFQSGIDSMFGSETNFNIVIVRASQQIIQTVMP